ncbi:hypothetical protein KSS87_016208 [Heliosperma pusillum]|nr:hypothetical protein KSS87_016208 [Heliosperma pusillum]
MKGFSLSNTKHCNFPTSQITPLSNTLKFNLNPIQFIPNSPRKPNTQFSSLVIVNSTKTNPSITTKIPPLVVVGSANADIYVEIDRLPKQGETISAKTGQTLAGGKGANQAVCGGKLSYPTYFVGQVGEDAHGKLVTEALQGGGVCLDHLKNVSGAPTGHAVVMLQSDGDNSIIIVGGANMCCWPHLISDHDLELVRNAGILLLQREIPDSVNLQVAKDVEPFDPPKRDAVISVSSLYNPDDEKLWLLHDIMCLIEAARDAGVPVILDAGGMDAHLPRELLGFVNILSPNESELSRLTGMPTSTFEEITLAVSKCHEMGVNQVLVKLGDKGSALFVEGEEPVKQSIISAPKVVDTTGAGDTFTAAFAVALVEGKSKKECLRFAAAAASLCVQVKGAIPSMPHRDAVLNLLRQSPMSSHPTPPPQPTTSRRRHLPRTTTRRTFPDHLSSSHHHDANNLPINAGTKGDGTHPSASPKTSSIYHPRFIWNLALSSSTATDVMPREIPKRLGLLRR